jgi:hypothetical protein
VRIGEVDFLQAGLDNIVPEAHNEGIAVIIITTQRYDAHEKKSRAARFIGLESVAKCCHSVMECTQITNTNSLFKTGIRKGQSNEYYGKSCVYLSNV